MVSQESERRKSEDFWLKAIRYSSLFAWGLFTIALVISYYAAPETEYGVLRYHNIMYK